ncbi:MAG: hypothetical protein J6F31_04875 [Oscillospiraceae bacterium]|nr:hypothetical protein [Oscillospiraceae bacterium]
MPVRRYLIPLLLCGLLFSSCGEEAAEPGGDYVMTIARNPANLDPQLAEDSASFTVIRNIYSTLVTLDDNGAVIPCGAKSYEVSEDGLSYTFYIREGLKWRNSENRDAADLTADDYIFAVKRVFDESTCSPYKYLFENIENIGSIGKGSAGIYARDSHTLCIRLSVPDCEFLKKMAHPAAAPCNEELFRSTEGRYGLSAEDTYACGAFYVSDWNFDPYWTNNHIRLTKIKANSDEGYVTYPDSVDILIDNYENSSLYTLPYGETPPGGYETAEYESISSVMVFNKRDALKDEKIRGAVFTIADTAINNSEEPRPGGFLPSALTVGGKSVRERGDMSLSFEHTEDPAAVIGSYGDKSHMNFRKIIVREDMSRIKLCYEISEALADAGFFTTVDILPPREFEERMESGDYDISVLPLSARENSAEEFFRGLFEITGAGGTDRLLLLSGMRDIGDKADYILNTESGIYREKAAIPLSYENRTVVCRDVCDYYYDPFGDSFYLKYLKAK